MIIIIFEIYSYILIFMISLCFQTLWSKRLDESRSSAAIQLSDCKKRDIFFFSIQKDF